jgi:GGDEF domain-containing protein
MTQLKHQFDVERRKGKHIAMLTLDFSDLDDSSEAEGERLLRKIEQSIRQRLRDGDSVAKIHNNSFVVLLESLHTQDNAEKVADALIENLSESLKMGSKEFNASVRVDFIEHED